MDLTEFMRGYHESIQEYEETGECVIEAYKSMYDYIIPEDYDK